MENIASASVRISVDNSNQPMMPEKEKFEKAYAELTKKLLPEMLEFVQTDNVADSDSDTMDTKSDEEQKSDDDLSDTDQSDVEKNNDAVKTITDVKQDGIVGDAVTSGIKPISKKFEVATMVYRVPPPPGMENVIPDPRKNLFKDTSTIERELYNYRHVFPPSTVNWKNTSKVQKALTDPVWSPNYGFKFGNATPLLGAGKTAEKDDLAARLDEHCRHPDNPYVMEVNRAIFGRSYGHPKAGSPDYYKAAEKYAIYGTSFLDFPNNTIPPPNGIQKGTKNVPKPATVQEPIQNTKLQHVTKAAPMQMPQPQPQPQQAPTPPPTPPPSATTVTTNVATTAAAIPRTNAQQTAQQAAMNFANNYNNNYINNYNMNNTNVYNGIGYANNNQNNTFQVNQVNQVNHVNQANLTDMNINLANYGHICNSATNTCYIHTQTHTHTHMCNGYHGTAGIRLTGSNAQQTYGMFLGNKVTYLAAPQTANTLIYNQHTSTSTNFISNSLANAALISPAGVLYSNPMLNSTQQYLNAYFKETQFMTNSTGIYDRLCLPQSLQQQQSYYQNVAAVAAMLHNNQTHLVRQTTTAAAAAAAACGGAGNQLSSFVSQTASALQCGRQTVQSSAAPAAEMYVRTPPPAMPSRLSSTTHASVGIEETIAHIGGLE